MSYKLQTGTCGMTRGRISEMGHFLAKFMSIQLLWGHHELLQRPMDG